jgi:hypothetical protein
VPPERLWDWFRAFAPMLARQGDEDALRRL